MNGYLSEPLAIPVAENDGLSAPFWEGLVQGELRIQHCTACDMPQWGPEWMCHRCHSFDVAWQTVAPRGRIFSWTRVWHPVRPSLKADVPYLVVLVELDGLENVRLLGNLLGDSAIEPVIGAPVEGVFEHHAGAEPPFALLQWQTL